VPLAREWGSGGEVPLARESGSGVAPGIAEVAEFTDIAGRDVRERKTKGSGARTGT
jgi:hypothetical protein